MAESSIRRRSVERQTENVELKDPYSVTAVDKGIEEDLLIYELGGWNDTNNDVLDMKRMGKKQEFKRNFNFVSSLGFVSIYMATWEFVLVSLSVGFSDGGFAGLFWCFITTVLCYSTIVASLAEMESMAPTAGGQYHWVSEFAPPEWQRVLSYASGWMSTLGWLASCASGIYVVGNQIQAIIEVDQPDFAFTRWQLTLVMIALVLITIVFNTWGAPMLPTLETASLIGHTVGFFVVMIPLWVLCPKNSAYDVFVDFENNSGYSNMGTAYLISQVYVIYCNLGSDSVVHISEEVGDASLTVPRCMWWSFVGNVILGIVMLITMLFLYRTSGPSGECKYRSGPSLSFRLCLTPEQLAADTPYLLLFNNTGSRALSIVLNILLLVLIFAGNVTSLATCSREMWAFARDHGLPFSPWIGKMNRKWLVPFNSVYATSAVLVVLALINIGSSTAFNIIVSLSLLGLLSTYMISIGCLLLKRIKGDPLPHARWSLGRWGIAINGFAFFYSAFMIVFCCFPAMLPVDLSTANWSPLVWVAVIIISIAFYIVWGNKHYTAPVDFVEGRKAAGVGLQSSQ